MPVIHMPAIHERMAISSEASQCGCGDACCTRSKAWQSDISTFLKDMCSGNFVSSGQPYGESTISTSNRDRKLFSLGSCMEEYSGKTQSITINLIYDIEMSNANLSHGTTGWWEYSLPTNMRKGYHHDSQIL
jgi:hypothetical protein